MSKKAIGSKCMICEKEDLPIKNLSKTVPLGHGKELRFWHEIGCRKESQGAVEDVDVSYWDLVGYSKD